MHSGYLIKRDSPQSPPSMQKVFCVLWGTMLLDYDNEDDAKTLMNPKLVVELVGVSEWDGKGRANYYPAGLLLVTRTRRNYYASCVSVQERDEWILHFKRSLECAFANNEIAPFKPSNIIQSRVTTEARNSKCPRTDYQVNSYSPKCNSCGRRFYSAEHVSEYCVLSQLGAEEAEKVCVDCKNAQMCIVWLKTMNYVQILDLHELTDNVLKNVKKFHTSFQLRRRLSQRLDMAGELFTNGSLTPEEFEELRSVDHAYRREVQHDECLRLRHAIEAFGEDLQTILNILLNDSMTSKGGRNAYFTLILRILELADQAPDLVDFYFPQLYQIHLQQLLSRSPDSYIKVDCLQQALLVLAQKYPSFGLKLSWSLMATVGDYQEKRATQVQYAACMALQLQLEMVMTGQISCIADVPTSKVLHQLLRPASHQQQEIGFEISALFLIRRQLQEAYDAEEEARKERNRKLYGDCNPDLIEEKEANTKKLRPLPLYPGTNHSCSCIELLYHLGVGQAPARTREMNSAKSHNNHQQSASQSATPQITDDSDHHNNNHDDTTNSSNNQAGNGDSVFYWDGFDRQIDFIGRLNTLVDHLRFVDRPLRGDTLKTHLHKWNNYGLKRSKSGVSSEPLEERAAGGARDSSTNSNNSATLAPSLPSMDDLASLRGRNSQQDENRVIDHNPKLGWDPTTIAGEPHYRITRIIVEECRVFRTKARAPTMIVCEVMRDDVYCQQYSLPSVDNHELGSSSTNARKSRDSNSNNNKNTYALQAPPSLDPVETGAVDTGDDQQLVVSPTASRDRAGSMAKMSRSVVVANSNRNRSDSLTQQTDSLAHNLSNTNNNSTTGYTDPQQSFHDVDNLIVSSLNPVIAEMQLHRQQQQQQQQQHLATSDASNSTSNNTAAQSSPNGNPENNSQRMGISTTHLPRRKSGGILPTNRLSASTEGILRSSSNVNLSVTAAATAGASTPTTSSSNNNNYNNSTNSSNVRQGISSSISHTNGLAVSQLTATVSDLNLNNNQNADQSSGIIHHVSDSSLLSSSGSATSPKGSVADMNALLNNNETGDHNGNSSLYGDNNNATLEGETVENTIPFNNNTSAKSYSHSTANNEDDSTSNANNITNGNSARGEHIEHIIASAQRLLNDGTISVKEYEQLIMSDLNYREEIAREAAMIEKVRVENVLGESFQSKKERILGEKLDSYHLVNHAGSSYNSSNAQVTGRNSEERIREVSREGQQMHDELYWPAYDLRSFIVKTNDDLRQEICCMQLMQIFKEIFDHFGLNHMLFLKPYRIISTGSSSGVIEVLKDAVSLDALKHTPGFTTIGAYFKKVYDTTPERLQIAKHNFMASLAAYSLFSYILLVKDRHNGNLLLDAEGHIIHIDFGFILSMAPGGSFSVETAPFKLTEEMVELLDGLDSPLFGEFVTAFTKGFIALQANCENIISAITILSQNSSFPCFREKVVSQVLEKLKSRFRTELNVQDAVKHCLDLITNSYGHYGTRQYDQFQYFTNGILP